MVTVLPAGGELPRGFLSSFRGRRGLQSRWQAGSAVANGSSGNVSILLGNGNGTFQPAVNYAVGTNPNSVIVADFNGDGKLDLAVANLYSNAVSILLGSGNGTFRPAVNFAAGFYPFSVATGDFNGDGKPDLAVAGPIGLGGGSSTDIDNVAVLTNTTP
jgi:hypothetical protein